jgi:excisionase family DNA binding protein
MISPFLFLTECAAHARVPVSTVRHWIAIGRLPSVRPGRRRMVRREDLEAFLACATAPQLPPSPTSPGSAPPAPGNPA